MLYRSSGDIPPKRHIQFRRQSNDLLHEELLSAQGFEGSYTLLYHVSPPTEVKSIAQGSNQALNEWNPKVHRHHMIDTSAVASSGDAFDSRRPLFFNVDVVISASSPTSRAASLYRNAYADELSVIARGTGKVVTQFGTLEYRPGDMVVVPRGVTQDWLPNDDKQQYMVCEFSSPIAFPRRYFTTGGQFAEHSPICERDIRVPTFNPPIVERGDFAVRIKTGTETSVYHLANHPFDVVGWDGCLYPYAINMEDYEPITRRIHTMPDESQIFETAGAAMCCLVPKMMDYHPLAIPAPPYHSSVDVDEILYHMSDEFMNKRKSGIGITTFHPRGIPHGAKPGGYEGSIGMKEFHGKAFMIDVAKPLRLSEAAQTADNASYWQDWLSASHSVSA